ncbi:hypothetical protein DDF65_22545 [Caulobacter radicis]|uniref:Uncharacterized protein n=1 Tax=Caulobacter radicis TaxID=2172650 RepID=A0A2T9IYT2_9CAUL|nr:hypothetical protein DDF65_22545 [Caulobacter radicis]
MVGWVGVQRRAVMAVDAQGVVVKRSLLGAKAPQGVPARRARADLVQAPDQGAKAVEEAGRRQAGEGAMVKVAHDEGPAGGPSGPGRPLYFDLKRWCEIAE